MRAAAAVEIASILRVETNCLVKVLVSLLVILDMTVGKTPVIVKFRIPRVQTNSFAEIYNRLFMVIEVLADQPS